MRGELVHRRDFAVHKEGALGLDARVPREQLIAIREGRYQGSYGKS